MLKLCIELKVVINSKLFVAMLDLKPAKRSIQQSAMSNLATKPTQYAIIAAIKEEAFPETCEWPSAMMLISSDWRYLPPPLLASLSLRMKKIHSRPFVSAPRMIGFLEEFFRTNLKPQVDSL
jgi:hypothetical protein